MANAPFIRIDRDEKFKIYRIYFKSLSELENYLKGDPEVNREVFKFSLGDPSKNYSYKKTSAMSVQQR